MNSIIQPVRKDEACCYLCDLLDDKWVVQNLEEHHIFQAANRPLSEKYGLKVWICRDCHREIHDKGGLKYNLLHEIGQSAFELRHGNRQAFMRIFGKNYLENNMQEETE